MTTDMHEDIEQIDARIRASLQRSLRLWVIRWIIGLAGAVAIVYWTGDHHWLPWAAIGVASVSLVFTLLVHASLRRKSAEAHRKADDLEQVLRDHDEDT